MEGWLNLRDGCALHEVENFQDSKGKKGSVLDRGFSLLECGFDEGKNRLRGLFNKVLVNFLEEKTDEKCRKPLPALCSNGRPVDFFKLFWVVRKLGGYSSISRENLWDFVAQECGLDSGGMASVKLIYIKYLYELDHWLWQGLKDRNFSDDGDRVVKNLEELLQDLVKEFRDGRWTNGKEDAKLVLSKVGKCGNGSDSGKSLVPLSPSRNMHDVYDCLEQHHDGGDEKFYLDDNNDLVVSAKQVIEKVINEVHGFSEGSTCDDDNKTCSQNENDVIVSTKKVIEKATSSNAHEVNEEKFIAQVSGDIMLSFKTAVGEVIDCRKRKRELSSLSEMLIWVKNMAKYGNDIAIGRMPDCSRWKDHGNENKLWHQALWAREMLLIRRHAKLPVKSSLQQKKFKMHPSMYEEDVSVEKSRCSQRLPLVKSHFCSCCNSAPQRTAVVPQKTEAGYKPEASPLESVDVASRDMINDVSLGEPPEKEVSVGPLFQAEVPEWTDDVSESDAKWLGIRVWPPEDVGDKPKPVVQCDPIGKGRPNTCDCSFPGHAECVRFHIAEKRLKLKCELGSSFYKWRFDRMGEEVSLSWTMEEEKRFKDMINLNSECTNKFWSKAFKLFPSKTRQELVSYYYNVFLVRRRSYQNRVTPKDVDSDDDEKELGSIGDSFGYKAIYLPELRLPVCSENKQCSEID